MTTLHPRGVNHLAISTCDMKAQLSFWSDVLGCPLRALYWMHGVEGCYHGFVELSADSYIAFVQHPDNPGEIAVGVTHAGNPGGKVTRGAMQHLALHVDTIDELLAMALERAALCSNDPFCASHDPNSELEKRYAHGAACHGCLLIAETSCERRNEFLDRALVVLTLIQRDAAFFSDGP